MLFLDVALVPLVAFSAIGYEQHLLSALFDLLFGALADPGAATGRASRIGAFALLGAALTTLGFGIGAEAWAGQD